MKSVWGQMPKTPSSRRIFKERLKLFTGPNHMYYDKDPIEYPMHKVKDCTWETNLRYKDRLVRGVKARGPKAIQFAKESEAKKRAKALNEFKMFLSNQLQDFGEERAAEVREQTEGQTPPRKKVRMYPNTRIPVQKVKANNMKRDLKWLMGTFR